MKDSEIQSEIQSAINKLWFYKGNKKQIINYQI
jgi:hypothetical protein